MPTYEYACTKCGHHFEQFQPMKDAPLKRCPKCGKLALKRLISGGGGLIFKGTGFYVTDYKKTSAPKESGGEGKAPAPAAVSKPDSKPDAKPAPKAAPKAPS